MDRAPRQSAGGTAHRARPGRRLRRVCALVAVVALLAAACAGAHEPASSGNGETPPATTLPTATDVAAEPLTPDDVATRLRTVEPSLTLVAQVDFRYNAGVFPSLMFRAQTATQPLGSDGLRAWLGAVLIYPTPAARQAVEPYFGSESIQAPGYLDYWDGQTHSEWVGVENVLVEIVMPGGSFGGRSPTPSELTYPESIRAALAAPPPAAAT
jgi:hypothetical protein